MNNNAYIYGQNLYLGTTELKKPWRVDLYKFRVYLKEKYHVEKAYYFLGCKDSKLRNMYRMVQDAGFELVFRAHSERVASAKKGNVDTDIVFMIMRDFHEHPEIDKFYLVSGDGDYFKTMEYLKKKGKLGKILFPARHKESSLYQLLGNGCYTYLDLPGLRSKIELK